MTRGVLAVLVIAAAAGPARADDPTATLQPVELVFAADEAGAGSTATLTAMTTAAATRAAAVTACFDKKKIGDSFALALVVVDKKGKTTKLAVGGTNDAALDKCLEKAIKPAKWPATSAGGAMMLTITNAQRKPVGQFEAPEAGSTMTTGTISATPKDEIDGPRVSSGASITLGSALGTSATYGESVMKKVQTGTAAYRACYDKALRNDPKLSGRLAIVFTIGGDGKVVAASANPSLSVAVDGCIIKVIKAMTFGSPPDGNAVDITLPFNLAPP